MLFATFYVTIILRDTKNIYKISSCKPHRLKANSLTNAVCNFHSIRLTVEKVIAKIKGVPI